MLKILSTDGEYRAVIRVDAELHRLVLSDVHTLTLEEQTERRLLELGFAHVTPDIWTRENGRQTIQRVAQHVEAGAFVAHMAGLGSDTSSHEEHSILWDRVAPYVAYAQIETSC